jgi:myosin heavy subunit
VNEPIILHNLRQRFIKDNIYTYVSSILVALNPFRMLPIYLPEVLDKYKDRGSRNQPPHIYAIADNAYANLMADFKDQAVVISGESGAGKTETMKLVLQFLAEASGRASSAGAKDGEKTESLEQQVLKSNPLMEAFGNAKTTRNNNSSRFGKWTEIKFNKTGAIVGGSIINYLLEKSRICYQAPLERSYHAFYQVIAGGEIDPAMKKLYKLADAETFHYTNQSGVTTVDGINDEKDWLEMTNAMDVLNMSADEKEQTFRLVSAVLQMGNTEFERDPKGSEETDSRCKNPEQMKLAADLFRIDSELLNKCICFRKIARPGSKSVTYARNSIQKAKDARDGMSKALYGKLFDWLIRKINVALMKGIGAGGSDKLATIGVLDIFGFESFATNSFEQLCINFCNEKLQFHFNEYIFKLEQDEYKSEGIPVDMIEFKDNQPTLDLLEKKGEGVLAMIDEELSVPKGDDLTFLKKVLAKHAKHPNFAAPKPKDLNSNLVFCIQHYAGLVPYNVTSFLEKNKDALNEDITDAINSSKCPLVSKLLRLDGEAEEALGKAKKKQPTLGFQFKESLQGLMASLYKCEPHFVRCMKSNHQKKGGIFESDMMLAQLRYAGLLEVCRIRKIGFPVRRTFDDFVFRYRCLDLLAAREGHKALCAAMEKKKVLEPRQWAIGFTKVFMRNLQQTKCETARETALMTVVTKMTKIAKGFIAKTKYKKIKKIVKAIKKALKTRTEEALDAALADINDLPYGGLHLSYVRDAKALLERLAEERRVTTLCVDAVKERDLNALRTAVKAADEMAPPFDSPAVAEARTLLDLMERERKAVAKLKKAVEARDLDLLTAAIDDGTPFGSFVTDKDAYKQAVSLKARIEEENACRKALKKAMKAKVLEQMYPALEKMSSMGLDSEELYKEAVALKDSLEEQAKALANLAAAIAERLLDKLTSALKKGACQCAHTLACQTQELPPYHAPLAHLPALPPTPSARSQEGRRRGRARRHGGRRGAQGHARRREGDGGGAAGGRGGARRVAHHQGAQAPRQAQDARDQGLHRRDGHEGALAARGGGRRPAQEGHQGQPRLGPHGRHEPRRRAWHGPGARRDGGRARVHVEAWRAVGRAAAAADGAQRRGHRGHRQRHEEDREGALASAVVPHVCAVRPNLPHNPGRFRRWASATSPRCWRPRRSRRSS